MLRNRRRLGNEGNLKFRKFMLATEIVFCYETYVLE